MFNDLDDLYTEFKNNKTYQIIAFLFIAFLLYKFLKAYTDKLSNSNGLFGNGMMIITGYSKTYSPEHEINTLGQEEIRREIIMPPVNPLNPNCGMVYPENRPSDEKRKETRMELMNMIQYNSNDDDFITIHSRPKGLFVIP